MNVRIVALLAALVPLVAVHATYLVAAASGQVDWCIPYVDSCTSISATGRKPPASYLFRATMLPAAAVIAAYWWLNYAWLASLQQRAGQGAAAANGWMLAFGLLACLGLVLYVTVLGEAGEAWARQRRAGAVLFFSFTYLAQLLLLSQAGRVVEWHPPLRRWLLPAMWLLCALLLLLGILTVLLDAWDGTWYDTVEDAFEWWLALLLQLNFLFGYLLWRQAGFSLAVDSS